MTDPYANLPAPPSAGNYPDRYVFNTPGQSVEGHLRDVRMTPPGGTYEPCPVADIQTTQIGPDGQPVCWSVFCNPTSLWRQLDAQRPPIGSYVRITFKGHEGQAKVFTLEVAPPGSVPPPAQMAAPVAQAPAPQAQGFPPAEAFGAPAATPPSPWTQAPPQPLPNDSQPGQPFPAPAAPSPWGG